MAALFVLWYRILFSSSRDPERGQNVFTLTLVEPQGDEKLMLPLLVITSTEKVAGVLSVTCCVSGETVMCAPVLPLAVIVPVPLKDHKVTVTVPEPFFGIKSGLGLAPIEHGPGVGVGVGVGTGVGVGVVVTLLLEKPFQVPVFSSYCQSSTRPDGCTATARAALPFVK